MLKPNQLIRAGLSAHSISVAETGREISKLSPTRLPTIKRFLLRLLFIAAGVASTASAQTPPPDHPNIVIILADDLGYGDVGFNGCPDIPTPNIDSVASNGVLCTDGYVTHPFCSPSRAALLTGRYQQRFGHEHQPSSVPGVFDDTHDPPGLPIGELLLPQLLKPAGYVSGLIGKWHLGNNLRPTDRGFDEFFGFMGGWSPYYNAQVFRNTTSLIETSYLTDAFTREGVSFINRHYRQPFFLLMAYNAPHEPYAQPPQVYMDRVANIADPNRRNYAAMVAALDDGVGQLLQTLQAQNILNNTLIFFLSDNGAFSGGYGQNTPLRGWKFNTLEGGIRVPFAVQWNGQLPSHLTYTQPISALDIVATAAAAAGVLLPTDRAYDGFNVIPFLTGQQTSPQRTLFWRVFGLGSSGPPGSQPTIWAVRRGPLKLVKAQQTGTRAPALYNLPNDVGETINLATSQPADVDALNSLYAQWATQLIYPLWIMSSDGYAAVAGSMSLPGDWNSFNKDDPTAPWKFTPFAASASTATPDAFDWLTNTIHVASVGGDTTPGLHSFTVVADSKYSHQWGGATINIDGTTSIPSFSGTSLGPPNNISFDDGYYYSFRVIDHMAHLIDPLTIAVMKTSAPPVSVGQIGQTPETPAPDEPVVVSILTNQVKSAEERIYLRWSTDFFITSHIVEATGSGMNYSATIPPQPAGTAVQYRIVTSTTDLSSFVTARSIDSLTLSTSSTFKFVAGGGTEPTPTPSPTATPTPSPTPTPTPSNQAPIVNAGPDQTIATHSATLIGSATDDGLPNPPGALTYTWSKVTGPGTVSFGDAHAAGTSANFSAGGVYNLKLTAADGALSGNDTVLLTVNKRPTANAGPDQTITLPSTVTLSGSATDDGIPNPPATVNYTWSKVSGPGTVGFADAHAARTTATFSIAGTYSLKLTASDSVFTGTDTVAITVNPNPNPTADLTLTITDAKSNVSAGQKNTYTIVVTNLGPSTATGAVVTDTFPAIFTGATFTGNQSGGASGFTASGSGDINDTVVIPHGSKITYKATGTISASANGSISDTATVRVPSGVSDPNLANNTATDTDTF